MGSPPSLCGHRLCWVLAHSALHLRRGARPGRTCHQALVYNSEDHCSELRRGRVGRHCQGGSGGPWPRGHRPGPWVRCLP
eukprot:3237893-Alexandrium_andersonii.AAC.1